VSTPTLPTDHDEYEALAVAWAVNALEPADQAVFEVHRDGCERCARAANAALDIAAELAYGVPDVAPPARLRERVLAGALPHIPEGQADARPGQLGPPPAARPAPDGATDRAENQRTVRPASSDDKTDRAENQRTVRPASDDKTDRAESERTVGPASDDKTDRSESQRTARPASDGEADRAEGRRAVGSASGGHAGRSGSRLGESSGSGGEAGRRPRGAGPGRMARAMRGPRRLAYALAAAVLVVGSAVATWEVTRPAPVTDRIAALSAGSETIATVVAHRHGADVVTDMLPPNTGRGTAYYVWGVPAKDGGTPQVVGTFEVTAAGLHSYPLRLTRSLEGYPVLAISEERAGSTPSAPSGVLGKGALGG
jgi:hypothetical protein